ncbi:MAG: hypothetical protein BWY06_01338 [Candidatus Latescibacteria bacterium ADurb.Bin168]|nr:MAG: hypothetical protein BWY06_01338 [Candidatus Latescibacteria bacterium ADurb.Bin168]
MRLEDIFPAIPTVTRILSCAPDLENEGLDFWIWFRSLQGLVNRAEPHLYLIKGGEVHKHGRDYWERHWLDYYTNPVTSPFKIPLQRQNSVDAIVERFRDRVNGYVLYDMADIPQTMNLAITLAGLNDCLPVAADQESWMVRHGIPRRDDLRGRFSDDWEAAEWAVDNLWSQCNQRLIANFCIHRPGWSSIPHELEDYVVRNRIFAIDLPASRQRRRVLMLLHRLLESAEAPGALLNWHCVFDQEKEYVAEAAKRGFFVLCSMSSPNLTIHGGVGDTRREYHQPLPSREQCVAESGKTYVCLYNSDGDATWATNSMQSGNWTEPNRGKFKFGWGILPLALKLQPAMVQLFHETKTPNDCFWGPSSGAGYTYSHLWPEHLVDMYLSESRRLLDQSGQNGCNMVNWYLQDWWREVEDDAAVRREQEALKDGPGLVCGLGGSPYAKSYLDGPIPKLHSVHVANVGHNTVADIIKFREECPTRPQFMFLFAQISPGIWKQIESELDEYAAHPEIVLLTMDEFFLTLQDAIKKGLVKDSLYEITEPMAERWLKAPGRHRLPICEQVTRELANTAHAEPTERRLRLAETAWTELVSREVESVARDRERFTTHFKGRTPFTEAEEADALHYTAFTVAWVVVRAAIQAQGVYANQRTQCLNDFKRLCGGYVDVKPFQRLFDTWETWDTGVPDVAELTELCDALVVETRKLRDALGPDESEAAFTNWPPRTI